QYLPALEASPRWESTLVALRGEAEPPGLALIEAFAAAAWSRRDTRRTLIADRGARRHERLLAVLDAQGEALHAPLLELADAALSAGPLAATEDRLAASPHAGLRWLAVGCLQRRLAFVPPGELRAACARYLEDSSPLVRRRALRTLARPG
ncbi:MAG: hypothetical protein H6740_27555, partial [Alphaproteobacteria bacterium]|nr:hypothetical protein [Alphaproteobacteria bacterium]